MVESPYVIGGLGTPGRRYTGTRHNVGFEVVARLADRWGAGLVGGRGEYLAASLRRGSRRVLLAQPTTFMNLSGQAVQGLLSFYRVETDHLLVVTDDVNLPLGTLRLRRDGSSGGHKGLDDIILRLGRDDFARLRVGVGNDRMPPDLTGFVLESFAAGERPIAEEMSDRAADAVEIWLDQGIDEAMNRFN
jgi:PTH1 family peptidyl-tRNA hydrolase